MPDTDEIPRDVGKLWGALKSVEGTIETLRTWAEGQVDRIAVILTGANGENGLRGDLRMAEADIRAEGIKIDALDARLREVQEWGLRLWEVERPASCLGIAAVSSLRKELEEREDRAVAVRETEAIERRREMVELRKARIAMMGTVGAAMLTSIAAVAVSLIR